MVLRRTEMHTQARSVCGVAIASLAAVVGAAPRHRAHPLWDVRRRRSWIALSGRIPSCGVVPRALPSATMVQAFGLEMITASARRPLQFSKDALTPEMNNLALFASITFEGPEGLFCGIMDYEE